MFTRFVIIEKYVDEVIDQSVDFSDVLAAGESVTAAAVKIVDLDANDVTSTLCPVGGILGTNSVGYRLVAAGTKGMTYHIYALATLNTGEVLGQCMRMFIPTP